MASERSSDRPEPDTHSGISPPHGNPVGSGTAEAAERRAPPPNAQDAQISTEAVNSRQVDQVRPEHEAQPEFADVEADERQSPADANKHGSGVADPDTEPHHLPEDALSRPQTKGD